MLKARLAAQCDRGVMPKARPAAGSYGRTVCTVVMLKKEIGSNVGPTREFEFHNSNCTITYFFGI